MHKNDCNEMQNHNFYKSGPALRFTINFHVFKFHGKSFWTVGLLIQLIADRKSDSLWTPTEPRRQDELNWFH
jgi:hypothetical protein